MAKQQQQQQTEPTPSVENPDKGFNLVADGKVIASSMPIYGKVDLTRGPMSVSDRWGRSVNAITARIPVLSAGIGLTVAIYGRLDDKTGKITYAPSLSNKTYSDDKPGSVDRLKAHIVSAIKAWPEWDDTRKAADHACRFGKVKVSVKNAAGIMEDLDTSLESEPEPAPKTEQPAQTL